MAELILQPDAAAGEDTHVRSDSPNTNYGNSDELHIVLNAGVWRGTLIRFTLPDLLEDGSSITSALLMTQFTNQGVQGVPGAVCRCVHPWVESEATYNIYATGSNWSGANASDALNRDETYQVETTLPIILNGYFVWPDIRALVLDALNNRSRELNLWIYRPDTEDVDTWIMASSDYATPSLRPKLRILYDTLTESVSGSGYLAAAHFGSVAPPTSGF